MLDVNHLKYICNIFNQSSELSVFLLDKQGKLYFESASSYYNNPLYQSKEELFQKLMNPNDSYEFPIIRTTSYLENFISIALNDGHESIGTILAGPVIDSRLTEEMIQALSLDLNVSSNQKEAFMSYYHSLTFLSKMKIIYLSLNLYYMIYQRQLDPDEVIERNRSIGSKIVEINNPDINISERRQEEKLHHTYEYEQKMFQCLIEGDEQGIIQYWHSVTEFGELVILSKTSQLRNAKNLGITVITLSTRAAIEGGIYYELAYTLSDLYIQKLEELNSNREVDRFIEYVLRDFTQRVNKNRLLKYSKPINYCIKYIFNHLYEKIELTTLAEIAEVHPSYLSSLFKEEVGMTITNYIHYAKIEESIVLLKFTNHSLAKISTILNFYDQSYFSKIFKRFTGVTPTQYRNDFFK